MQVSKENHTKSVTKSQSTYKTDAKSLFSVTKDERDELARAAFEDGDRPAERLFKLLGSMPCLYTLRWPYLGLSRSEAGDKSLIYDPATIDRIKAEIRRQIKPPYAYCIEVGEEGLIHAQVVAGYDAGLPGVTRNYKTVVIEVIKNTQGDRFRVIRYIFKASVRLTVDKNDPNAELLPDANERLNGYFQAVKELGKRNLPELRGFVFTPKQLLKKITNLL